VAITISDEYLRKASRIWKQRLEEDEEEEDVGGGSNSEVEQSLFKYILVR
jgi:hypothetical protein